MAAEGVDACSMVVHLHDLVLALTMGCSQRGYRQMDEARSSSTRDVGSNVIDETLDQRVG